MSALLRAEGVCKAFGGVQALGGCTVEVAPGSITGLIGPNGSGKTTLFNVITGYERLDAGEVYVDGTRITNAPPQRVFGLGIGRTFQLTRIFPVPLAATENRGSVSCALIVVAKKRLKKAKNRILSISGITYLLKRCFEGNKILEPTKGKIRA